MNILVISAHGKKGPFGFRDRNVWDTPLMT